MTRFAIIAQYYSLGPRLAIANARAGELAHGDLTRRKNAWVLMVME